MFIRTVLFVFLLLRSTFVLSQTHHLGTPRIINHTKSQMNAQSQNWAIDCDSHGNVFVGNNVGLLHYNGNSWQKYPISNKTSVRSLVIQNDTVWIGAQDEIGYYSKDQNSFNFRSIKENIPEKNRSFADVWKLIRENNTTAFLSINTVFVAKDTSVFVTGTDNPIISIFNFNDKTYFHDINLGLFIVKENTISPVPGSEILRGIGFSILEKEENCFFFLNNGKIVVWNENGFLDVSYSFDPIFNSNPITVVQKLDIGFAFGTESNGLFITDPDFRPIYRFNRNNGLQSNKVNDLAVDIHGNLWSALDKGVDYIDINSAFSVIHCQKESAGYSASFFDNNLFLGTNKGLFRKEKDENYVLIPGTEGQVWNINESLGSLWLSHQEGAFIYDQDQFLKIPDTYGSWKVIQLNEEYAIQGNFYGVSLFKKNNGRWQKISQSKNFSESSRFIELDNNATIWIAHPYKGIFNIEIDLENEQFLEAKTLGTDQGLTTKLNAHLFKIRNEIVVSTPDGLFRYDPITDQLKKLESLCNDFDTEFPIRALKEDNNGNLWFVSSNQTGVLIKEKDHYTKRVFSLINKNRILGFENINFLANYTLFGLDEGFIAVDNKKTYDLPLKVSLQSIGIHGDILDSLIYLPKTDKIDLEYDQNSITFNYTSNYSSRLNEIDYRWRLLGLDTSWSIWSHEHKQVFNRLNHGEYVFEIQTLLNNEIAEDSIKFIIHPPWYLSNLAKFIYGVIALLLLILIALVPNKKYKKEKKKLIIKNQASQQEINRLKAEQLEAEIKYKNGQLASSTMHVLQKNDTLIKLKDQIEKIRENSDHPATKKDLKKVLSLLKDDIRLNEDWENFAHYFDEVHSDFTVRIKKEFPSLSAKDLKLCAYLKMNLTTKEIAPLLNISVRGVEISRYRLRKKLGIAKEVNLNEFMSSY